MWNPNQDTSRGMPPPRLQICPPYRGPSITADLYPSCPPVPPGPCTLEQHPHGHPHPGPPGIPGHSPGAPNGHQKQHKKHKKKHSKHQEGKHSSSSSSSSDSD